MTEVISVRFLSGHKSYDFDPRGLTVTAGEDVIVETSQGVEYAVCCEGNHEVPDEAVVQPLCPVIRLATDADRRTLERNRAKETEAFNICQDKIADHQLEMKLVDVSCNFDGNKIIFFFTADGRVDFRELVKDLAAIFRARIELRQIGVRDEAKMLGGLGICGRPFCCKQFLPDFVPVSIKMAKTQNLSLNPTKISGTCGRLMCCLKYEQDAYEDLIRTSPKMESFVDTPEGRGTVVEIDLLRQRVKVRMEDAPETISVFKNTDIAILRSGKAKKNDPPIPADLAPISGSGKRVRRKFEEEESMQLEPIRFRYSTESVVEEVEGPAAEPVQETEEAKPGRSRRRRKPQGNAPREQKEEQPSKPEKQEKPKKEKEQSKETKTESENEPARKNSRRRPNHRRRKPNKPAGDAE